MDVHGFLHRQKYSQPKKVFFASYMHLRIWGDVFTSKHFPLASGDECLWITKKIFPLPGEPFSTFNHHTQVGVNFRGVRFPEWRVLHKKPQWLTQMYYSKVLTKAQPRTDNSISITLETQKTINLVYIFSKTSSTSVVVRKNTSYLKFQTYPFGGLAYAKGIKG